MKYQGFIRMVREMEGTKSEGDYAYLEVDDKTSYRLYRYGHPAADSLFLRPYEGMFVSVDGELEANESLCINSINDEKV
jgi:hypothetical protein